jgi:hypothetical protein
MTHYPLTPRRILWWWLPARCGCGAERFSRCIEARHGVAANWEPGMGVNLR